MLRPFDPAALVREDDFAENEFLPYWAEVWPSALRLAPLLTADLAGKRVVEVGCGIGIPSLVAAALGAEVLATDWAPDAIELLTTNALRNGLTVTTRRIDWSSPAELVELAPFDLVLAADVLYEERNIGWLLALLPKLSDQILLADPGRKHCAEFLAAIAGRYSATDLGGGVTCLDRRSALR